MLPKDTEMPSSLNNNEKEKEPVRKQTKINRIKQKTQKFPEGGDIMGFTLLRD